MAPSCASTHLRGPGAGRHTEAAASFEAPTCAPAAAATRLCSGAQRVRAVRREKNAAGVTPLLLGSVAFERAESESEKTLKIVDSK